MMEMSEIAEERARQFGKPTRAWVDLRGISSPSKTASTTGEDWELVQTSSDLPGGDQSLSSLVLVLPMRLSAKDSSLIQECAKIAQRSLSCHVCAVTSFHAHFADGDTLETEAFVQEQFEALENCRLTILRTGHILSEESSSLNRLAAWHPLAASRFRSCFLTPDEFYAVVNSLVGKGQGAKQKTITLLGKNRHLREVLLEMSHSQRPKGLQTGLAMVLNLLLVGWLIGVVYGLIARFSKPWRIWQCHTLEPQSVAELMALYNPYNYQHVALAGYNTGVVHFGWEFPSKTVVKTIGTGRRLRIDDLTLQVDAGKTLKEVLGALREADRELYVVPNYSYISMGTIFFVPVHGSGSEVSVLGDTVESALIYDPLGDQFLNVKRGDSLFGKFMYNTQSHALVLRLKLRVRPKSRYFVRKEIRQSPSAQEVWSAFLDREASNIELRKSKAADEKVEISKYYTSSGEHEEVLEVPKDTIGKLWDRLEENPVTSYLFHEMVKRLGFHVELFLNEDEFPVFWDVHLKLPLSKIQLRYVRSDGLPHSPVGERDCISADIFMKRSKSAEFLAFMKERLPDAKYNPGKHSM